MKKTIISSFLAAFLLFIETNNQLILAVETSAVEAATEDQLNSDATVISASAPEEKKETIPPKNDDSAIQEKIEENKPEKQFLKEKQNEKAEELKKADEIEGQTEPIKYQQGNNTPKTDVDSEISKPKPEQQAEFERKEFTAANQSSVGLVPVNDADILMPDGIINSSNVASRVWQDLTLGILALIFIITGMIIIIGSAISKNKLAGKSKWGIKRCIEFKEKMANTAAKNTDLCRYS